MRATSQQRRLSLGPDEAKSLATVISTPNPDIKSGISVTDDQQPVHPNLNKALAWARAERV